MEAGNEIDIDTEGKERKTKPTFLTWDILTYNVHILFCKEYA